MNVTYNRKSIGANSFFSLIVVMLTALLGGNLYAASLEKGSYTISNNVAHDNPVGQGMARSYTEESSKIEVSDGEIYLVLGFNNTQYMGEFTIKVNGSKVSYEVAEHNTQTNIKKLKFKIPDLSAKVMVGMHVVPMNTDVEYTVTLDQSTLVLVEKAEVTPEPSVKPEASKPVTTPTPSAPVVKPTPSPTPTPSAPAVKPTPSITSSEDGSGEVEVTPSGDGSGQVEVTPSGDGSGQVEEAPSGDGSGQVEEAPSWGNSEIVEELSNEGDFEEGEEVSDEESSENNKGMMIGGIVAIVVIVAGASYFIAKRKQGGR